ncbi:FAD-dependent oxidoreductase domain-containing protein 1 [Drosophila subobscura]|uniref:FAD-dependent oxidoreductase domain-containing protein 1 n=1 Tax=Drosophila subobscura TaxID=7241 RepID=UPI00155B2390|nr:FAD-dependent oxidoreductase domain-containing protein 1 [Drosophila subobscura]
MLRYRHVVRILTHRSYSSGASGNDGNPGGSDSPDEDKHPIRRTFRILGNDMRKVKEFFVPKDPIAEDTTQRILTQSKFNFEGDKGPDPSQLDEFQTHCDVLIIGGGGVGSSIAYWLKEKARDGLNVVVVEKDETYAQSATRVSVGGLCQQFSLPENIQMSLFAADFLRNAKEQFGSAVPLNFTPQGHLLLAGEEGAESLKNASQLQNELGARNELLTPDRLAARFPWLNTKGVALGCHGIEKEGWFNSWALLTNFRRSAGGHGAHFVNGEVVDFDFQEQPDITVSGDNSANEGCFDSLDKAVIQLPDGTRRTCKFALCVIAAGANSGNVGRLARIGTGAGMLRVPLPIDARKRYMYAITTQAQNAPGMAMPIIIDSNGTFIRRDGLGGNYICGHNSDSQVDPNSNNCLVDPQYFEQHIRPALVERVPAFEAVTVVDSWAGLYEHNVYDENGIVGPHPYYHNLYIATGFSGHGIQQSVAVGRAICELIMDGQFRTIDLSRLSFDRLIVDRPMYELNNVLS